MARLAYLREAPLTRDDRAALAHASTENFFLGELSIGRGTREVRVKLEVAAGRHLKIISYRSAIRQTYRRTIEHIRADLVDLYLLWVIESGFLRTNQAGKQEVCHGPALTVTKSDQPFKQELVPFGGLDCVAKIALIPGHLFRAVVSAPQGFYGKAVEIGHGPGKAVQTLVDLLYSEADHLSNEACIGLTQQCLNLLNEVSHEGALGLSPPLSLRARRMTDILSTIDGILFEPSLDPEMIADRCGISRGYLHRIFGRTGTTCSRYVERRRLEIARKWLVDPAMTSHTIAQLSDLAGFSCPAHFSRAFRRAFGDTPRAVRARG